MTIENAIHKNDLYDGMTPSEALRYLNKRFIRKAECKDMLTQVAEYIEKLENDLISNNTSERLTVLSEKFDNVTEALASIEKTLDQEEGNRLHLP